MTKNAMTPVTKSRIEALRKLRETNKLANITAAIIESHVCNPFEPLSEDAQFELLLDIATNAQEIADTLLPW